MWRRVMFAVIAVLAAGTQVVSADRDGSSQTGPKAARDRAAKGGHGFERQGVQIGQVVDDLIIYTLEGKEFQLGDLWKERPALIVSASLTCPIARNRCGDLRPIIEAHGKQLNVVVLYTIEAHPKGSESPYRP